MSIPADGSGTGRLLRKNVTSLGLAYLVAGVAGFTAQAYLGRRLGRDAFGVYIAAYSLVAIVGVAVRGKQDFVVRGGARDPGALGGVISDVLRLQLGLAVVIGAAAAGIAAAIGFTPQGILVALLLAFMVGSDAATDAFRAGLQAIERLEVVAAISIGVSVASAILMVVAVAAGWGLTVAVMLSLGVSLAAIPVAWTLCRRHVPLTGGRGFAGARSVLRASLPFTAIEVLTFAVGYADALVIRSVLGEAATGAYGAAYRLIAAVGWIGIVFGSAAFRTMTALAHDDHDGFVRFVRRAVAGMALIGLPFAVGGAIVGGRLVTLVFGPAFAAGSSSMQVLTLALPFSLAASIAMLAIVAGDRPRSAGWIMFSALAANVAANVVLVPRHGLIAAAWTTVATEVAVLLAAWVTLARRGVALHVAGLLAPGAIGAAALAAAVYPLRDAPIVLPLAAGAIVYAATLLAARVPARLGITVPAMRSWKAA